MPNPEQRVHLRSTTRKGISSPVIALPAGGWWWWMVYPDGSVRRRKGTGMTPWLRTDGKPRITVAQMKVYRDWLNEEGPVAPEFAPLRTWRSAQDLTLQEVAELTGLSVSYISRIESGERLPPPRVKVEIARALGCKIRDLFDLEEVDV